MGLDLRDLPVRAMLEELSRRFPKLDVSAVETSLLVLHTADAVSAAFEVNFARYGLSQGKFNLLMLLRRHQEEGLAPSELATRAGVTRGTITGLLDGLERAALVERRDDPRDRRMMRIHLTRDGQALLERILPDQYQRTAGLMSHLSEEERQQLNSLMSKLREGIPALTEP